ncbi:hypothetical protein HDV04_006224 [Boothiomyces sp. JEL0838]|nr:hypothetical protein HDV04_006224 [Boothiomyces sp. JEL0838]
MQDELQQLLEKSIANLKERKELKFNERKETVLPTLQAEKTKLFPNDPAKKFQPVKLVNSIELPPETKQVYIPQELQPKEIKKETAGKGWFDMTSTPLTDEVKRDLHIIKNRAALDPKRHYKRDTVKTIPKFFQMGTVVGDSTDYRDRLTRKERKQTIVEELLNDTKTRDYMKRKVMEVEAKRNFVTRKGWKKKRK